VVSPLVRAADRGPSGGLARDRARRGRAGLGRHRLRQDAGRLTFTGSIASVAEPAEPRRTRLVYVSPLKASRRATRPRPSRWYDSSASRGRIAERDGRRVRLTRQRRARWYAPTAYWRSSTSPRRRSPPSTGPGRHDRDRCVSEHRRPPSWSPRSRPREAVSTTLASERDAGVRSGRCRTLASDDVRASSRPHCRCPLSRPKRRSPCATDARPSGSVVAVVLRRSPNWGSCSLPTCRRPARRWRQNPISG
jgi:hypothetical protein